MFKAIHTKLKKYAPSDDNIMLLVFAMLLVVVVFFIVCVVIIYSNSMESYFFPIVSNKSDIADVRAQWGQLGDFFGGTLNPLFGFVSLFALLMTIVYQARSLRNSSEELRLSREELSKSSAALAAQNKAIELQSFEQTFFSWLDTYRSLLDSVEFETMVNNIPFISKGRRALIKFIDRQFHSLNEQIAKGNFQTDAETVVHSKNSWENTYKENEFQLDSLFRTLYRLFLWVDQNAILNSSEKWLYISIIRSQLSWIEMVYLYHNCLTERGLKFKPLVEKYAIFDNLAFNNDKKLVALQSEYLAEAFSSDLAREKLGLLNTA